MVYIYVLIDPRDYSYRYIGKTIDPDRRLSDHIKYSKDPVTPKDWWVKKLVEMELEPIMRLLIEVQDRDWERAEKAAIAYYREIGAPLLNLTDGGDGAHGYEWTDKQKENLSEMALERWQDPEYRAAWYAGLENRDMSYLDDEFKKRMSLSAIERWSDPEVRQRYLDGFKKREENPDYIAWRSENSREIWSRPGFREKQRELSLERWQDKEYRKKHAEGMANCGVDFSEVLLERWQDPEFIEKHAEAMEKAKPLLSEISSERWQDPDYIAKQEAAKPEKSRKISETLKKRYRNPEFEEQRKVADKKRSETLRELWSDPEFKAKQLAKRNTKPSDIQKASDYLGVCRSLVNRWCRQGRLGKKVDNRWVITDKELEEFAKIPRKRGPKVKNDRT